MHEVREEGRAQYEAWLSEREEWPVHQPGPAYEAPIPGTHWYGGCEVGYPRVNPMAGRCEGCGETNEGQFAVCWRCGATDARL